MKHFEILVGRDGFTVDLVKTRWWLVEEAMNAWCRLTGCRGCWGPLQMLQYKALNTHRHFSIPADTERLREFVAWAGFNIDDQFWGGPSTEDCEATRDGADGPPNDVCFLLAGHEGDHHDQENGARWPDEESS